MTNTPQMTAAAITRLLDGHGNDADRSVAKEAMGTLYRAEQNPDLPRTRNKILALVGLGNEFYWNARQIGILGRCTPDKLARAIGRLVAGDHLSFLNKRTAPAAQSPAVNKPTEANSLPATIAKARQTMARVARPVARTTETVKPTEPTAPTTRSEAHAELARLQAEDPRKAGEYYAKYRGLLLSCTESGRAEARDPSGRVTVLEG